MLMQVDHNVANTAPETRKKYHNFVRNFSASFSSNSPGLESTSVQDVQWIQDEKLKIMLR